MPLFYFALDEDRAHVEAPDMVSAIRAWKDFLECDEDPDQVTLLGENPVIREKSAASVEGS